MNILLLGGGGREHALAWKLSQSKHCNSLFIAPGNAGTATCGLNVDIDPEDFSAIESYCLGHAVKMIVVGPEAPLVAGIYDHFKSNGEIAVIGPSRKGAMLEGSKSFAKQFMHRHNIPTAGYREFGAGDLEAGLDYIDSMETPIVLKADGLAAGKGVIIAPDASAAKVELKEMLSGKFGHASDKVVIEEFMSGIECSVFVFTDGRNYTVLPVAKDYKRIGEGDTGLNTGGMGAVSPVPFADESFMKLVEKQIIQPTIAGLAADDITYKGIIYFGLMNVSGEPKVVEYNCRFGDPEAEILIPLIDSDLVEVFDAIHNGTLDEHPVHIKKKAAVTVVMAAGGYPGKYKKGLVIEGLDEVEDSLVFHAGTTVNQDKIVTNGGRVLAITTLAERLEDALHTSLANAIKIRFQGKQFRQDIGKDVMAYLK